MWESLVTCLKCESCDSLGTNVGPSSASALTSYFWRALYAWQQQKARLVFFFRVALDSAIIRCGHAAYYGFINGRASTPHQPCRRPIENTCPLACDQIVERWQALMNYIRIKTRNYHAYTNTTHYLIEIYLIAFCFPFTFLSSKYFVTIIVEGNTGIIWSVKLSNMYFLRRLLDWN